VFALAAVGTGLVTATSAAASGPHNVNFTGDSIPLLVRASHSPETSRRLVELKSRCDPNNLFRLDENSEPTR
jgi:hypothetical protein